MPEIELGHYRPVSADLEELFAAPRATSAIPGYISEFEFADQLGVAVATVRRWRRERYGPQAVAIGRRFYYPQNAAQTFADQQMKEHEPRRRVGRRS